MIRWNIQLSIRVDNYNKNINVLLFDEDNGSIHSENDKGYIFFLSNYTCSFCLIVFHNQGVKFSFVKITIHVSNIK